MTEPERIFISYRIPARSREAAWSIVGYGVFALACAVISWRLLASTFPEVSVTGCMVLLAAMVAAVTSIGQLLRYISNRVEEIIVNDLGVTGDSKFWDWAHVRQVDLVRRQRVVFIHVNNGPMRSRLSLLIKVPGEDAESIMQDLRTFVANKGITVREREEYKGRV